MRVATEEEALLGERFATLFEGRTDAYGTEAGGCVHQPVTFVEYWAHLWGAEPIGIYPVVESSLPGHFLVKFGAIDIDYEDIQEAWNIHDLLKSVDINSWVERSRSKGYHVWVFVEDWMPAKTMRHALLVVRDFLKIKAREVYPKQTELAEGELGNYIRLPYPGWLADQTFEQTQRRAMLLKGTLRPVMLQEFLSSAELYANPKGLEALASRYVEPKRTHVNVGVMHGEDRAAAARDALHRLNIPLLWHIVRHGPSEDRDRSSTLMRIANMAANAGATPEECVDIVFYADTQFWCLKYACRTDGTDLILALVERVYSTLP